MPAWANLSAISTPVKKMNIKHMDETQQLLQYKDNQMCKSIELK
jgi:hypothetical protein